MAKRGQGKQLSYQTRRQAKPNERHPDWANGTPLNPKKLAPKLEGTRSWWTATEDFYATAKAELGRMSAQNKFGKLNTEIE